MRITFSLVFGLVVLLWTGGASAQEAALQKGKQVYDYWCATCHGEGPGKPGTTALAAKYKESGLPGLLEARTNLTPQSVRFFIRNGASIMPFFRKTEVSDADVDAIAAYLTRPKPAAPPVAPQAVRP